MYIVLECDEVESVPRARNERTDLEWSDMTAGRDSIMGFGNAATAWVDAMRSKGR